MKPGKYLLKFKPFKEIWWSRAQNCYITTYCIFISESGAVLKLNVDCAERNQYKIPIMAHLYSKIKVFGTQLFTLLSTNTPNQFLLLSPM